MGFILIAGPCVIESEEMVMEIAGKMKKIVSNYNVDYYFKASFDKANRTSLSSYRGPGIEKGLEILKRVKKEYGLKICTDIHEPWQAGKAAEVADIIQIPAFLCRQTDLLVAAAQTGRVVNIKKGQFMAPWDMKNVVEKVRMSGNDKIMLSERGTSFGYNQLVVDMTSIVEMKKNHVPVIMDATHSVQKPGGNGTSTGGSREYVEYLAKAAIATGADGVFMEVHPNPEKALSDGPNSIRLADVEDMLRQMLKIYEAVQKKKVYIAGAHSRGRTLRAYLEYLYQDIEVEAFLVDDMSENEEMVDGLPVRLIGQDLHKEYPVWLGMRGVNHEKVSGELRDVGMKEIIPVTVELDRQLRNEYVRRYEQDRGRAFCIIDELSAGTETGK